MSVFIYKYYRCPVKAPCLPMNPWNIFNPWIIEKQEQGDIMKMIKGGFARKLNKLNGWNGGIWQKGFYDECIMDSLKLIKILEYIHYNPVKENLVTSPEEYIYSSYNHYMQSSRSVNPIIEIDKPCL